MQKPSKEITKMEMKIDRENPINWTEFVSTKFQLIYRHRKQQSDDSSRSIFSTASEVFSNPISNNSERSATTKSRLNNDENVAIRRTQNKNGWSVRKSSHGNVNRLRKCCYSFLQSENSHSPQRGILEENQVDASEEQTLSLIEWIF